MGLLYDRIDIAASLSLTNGATVPVEELVQKVENMVYALIKQPTCIVPEVLSDPFLEN